MHNNPNDIDIFENLIHSKKLDQFSYYDKLAYELSVNPKRIHAVPERQKEFKKLTTTVCNLFENIPVLELACGIGYWTEKLLKKSSFVYATDISSRAIGIVKNRVISNKVNFSQADARIIELMNINIKGIFSGFFLSHLKRHELKRFFENLHNQTPAGTTILFVDNQYSRYDNRRYKSRTIDGNTYELRPLQDNSLQIVVKNSFTDTELKSTLGPKAHNVNIVRTKYFLSLSYFVG